MYDFILTHLISIFVILYIILSTRKGYVEGIFRKILSLSSILIAILVTRFFAGTVVIFVKDYTNIQSTIKDILSKRFADTNIFDKINLTELERILDTNELNRLSEEFIANNLTDIFLNAICSIGLFIITIIALKIIIRMMDILDFIPVIGKINKTIGGILGFIESILILWLFLLVIKVFSNIPQVKVIEKYIEQTFFVGQLYKNNIIYNFFSALFVIGKL